MVWLENSWFYYGAKNNAFSAASVIKYHFPDLGPFKYFVVHTESVFFVTRALWGACHRHNWGLCINSD